MQLKARLTLRPRLLFTTSSSSSGSARRRTSTGALTTVGRQCGLNVNVPLATARPVRTSPTVNVPPLRLLDLNESNTVKRTSAAAPPPPQSASRTPGLDAFTFEYSVGWPLSLVLSKHAITKYQLLFRHLFHCKHVERQLASSWLSQQATRT